MKPGYTAEEHRKLAAELRGIRAQLRRVTVDLPRAYAMRSKAVALATKAEQAVGDLRCEMDNLFFEENPDGDSPYYSANIGETR